MISRKSMLNSAPTYVADAPNSSQLQLGSSTSAGTVLGPNGGQGEAGDVLEHESFFEREKSRLIEEISGGFEELMTSTNVLNRKLEEVWGVGKEFETVAGLWGKFNMLIREQRADTATSDDPTVVNLTQSLQTQSLGPGSNVTGHQAGGVPGTGSTTFASRS